MKLRLLSILFLTLVLPIVCLASEGKFFSASGKYVLSPETALVISKDDSEPFHRYKLVSDSNGISAPMNTRRATDPFLVYWDAGTQTLWWGTPQFIGYLDAHTPHSGHSDSRFRVARDHDQSFPQLPAVFTSELDRTVPIHP